MLCSIGPVCLICDTCSMGCLKCDQERLRGKFLHGRALHPTDEGFPYLPQILKPTSQDVRIMCEMHFQYIAETYLSELEDMSVLFDM